MQALGDVAYADLSGPAQTTLSKFEIYDGADWINLCALMPPDAPLFGWPHRKLIALPIPTADLVDFPVKVPIVGPDSETNVLIDGGLEDWASATDLNNWTEEIYGTSTVNRESTVKHGGTYSARLAIDAGNQLAAVRQNAALTPGAPTTLRFWYRTAAGKTAKAGLFDSAENVVLKSDGTWEAPNGGSGIDLPAATEWTEYSLTFNAHASYTNYYLKLHNLVAASSSIYFDDVFLGTITPGGDEEIGGKARADGFDIRFTAADGVTELPYERESWAGGGGAAVTAIFWVKTDVAMAGTYIWCYYGNAAAPDGENAEAVWDASFAAVYHMKDATTSTILDSTANDNDGTKTGANEPIEADGKIGKGQDFDGANDAINCGHATSLDGASLTVEAWVPSGSLGGVVGRHSWLAQQKGFWVARAAGYFNFLVGDGTEHYTLTTAGFTTEQEMHFVGTWVGGVVSIYINGSLVISSSGHAYAPYVGVDLRISYNDVGWFDGILDEIRISSIARSAEWIAYEYANMNPADGGLTWGEEEAFPKSYLKSLSLQLGGAGMSPDPIAGQWSAEIFNEDGIFHPLHPTSPYSNYFRVGRKVRISYGATYNGTDYYWQRLIGYMDAPSFDSSAQTVSISGGDYMKALVETDLRSPDNYWGATETFSTVATQESLGSELYSHVDAVNIDPEENTMDGWTADDPTRLTSEEETGGGSVYVAQLTAQPSVYSNKAHIDGIGSLTSGKQYKVTFKYRIISGTDEYTEFQFRIYKTGGETELMGGVSGLGSWEWATGTFYFTATSSGAMRIWTRVYDISASACGVQFDVLSIKEVTGHTNTSYALPAGCNGPYFVTLEGTPIFWNDPPTKSGWLYDEAGRLLSFVEEATIAAGSSNLIVYYFTTQDIVDVVADILVTAGLYASQGAALAALDYIDPDISIPKVWFDAGTSCLAAMQKICERCNYRFWFTETGVPTFLPALTLDDPIVSLEAKDVSVLDIFQDLGEIRNTITIEGIEQGQYSTAKDKDTSRLKESVSDAASIAAYLEHAHSIVNDLFQDQASLDAAAATMLAAFKDGKWYATLDVPHNPIPLELGDTVGWETVLSPTLKVEAKGIIRDASLSDEGFNYKVEMESGLMNISNYTQASSPVAVSVEQCKGWVLTNAGATADVHFDLPAATVGMEIEFYCLAAQTITIDPNGTERIAVLTGTAGDYLRSDAVIGSCIKLVCLVAGYWHKKGMAVGTWTEE